MSNSVQPHRRQPTRLPLPWDSPGKNTGVRCHFLLQCMKVKSESEVAQSCPTLSDPMDCSLPGSFVHGIFQARVLEWGAIAVSANQLYSNIKIFLKSPRSSIWNAGAQYYTSSAQFSLVTQSCLTLCNPMDFSTPGFPVHHQFPEPTQTHIHHVVMPSTISSSVVPFSSHLQSFPASGSFQMSWFLESGGQNIGVSGSTSVFPMNTQV